MTKKYVALTPISGIAKKVIAEGATVELDEDTATPLVDCGALRLADGQGASTDDAPAEAGAETATKPAAKK